MCDSNTSEDLPYHEYNCMEKDKRPKLELDFKTTFTKISILTATFNINETPPTQEEVRKNRKESIVYVKNVLIEYSPVILFSLFFISVVYMS